MKEPAPKKKVLAISGVLDGYLRAFAEFYFLTAEQVTRRFYKPGMITTVQTRLKALVDAGYLHFFMLPTIRSKSPYIYALSKKGVNYLLHEDEIAVPVYYTQSSLEELSHPFLWHVLELNDLLLAARSLPRFAPGWTVERMWHDLSLRRKPLIIPGSYFGENGTPQEVRPDGFLDIRLRTEGKKQRQYCIWIELDRGTEQTIDAFKDKIRRIAAAVTSGKCQEYFEFKHLSAVVFATTSGAKRVEQMQKWTMQELAEMHAKPELVELFLFAHFSPSMPPHEIFFKSLWVTPRKEDAPIALLDEISL